MLTIGRAIYSRDRNLTSNGNAIPFGGADFRSSNKPGGIFQTAGALIFFWIRNSLLPHHTRFRTLIPIRSTFRSMRKRFLFPSVGHNDPILQFKLSFFNFAALTPAIPAADRQSFYGSFTRDLCDKYLTVFADFKYTRSFFNAALAPTPFTPDPFHDAQGIGFSPIGISVPTYKPI